MNGLFHDIRYGVRTLRRNVVPTLTCLVTLGLGIGASSAMFSVLDGVLLKPLPYRDADRIVRLSERPPRGTRAQVSTLNFLDWQRDSQVFDAIAASTAEYWVAYGSGGLPVKLLEDHVSPRYFDLFGAHAELGRTFAPDEDQPGKDHVVVLSHALWSSVFGGDPALIGRPIRLDGQEYTVVGVMPPGGPFDRSRAQMWAPLVFEPAFRSRAFRWLYVFGRLKPGVTQEQAQAEMTRVGAAISQAFPDSNRSWGVVVERYADTLVGASVSRSLYLLFAAVSVLLLLACTNVANIVLARGVAREREVAVRSALGGGGARLARQFVVEHTLLSLAGAALGVAIGYGAIAMLRTAVPPDLFPAEAAIAIDRRVLVFALAVSVVTGVVFGLMPVRTGATRHLSDALRQSGARGATGGVSHRAVRRALIVVEVALTFVLVMGAGLLSRSIAQMRSYDIGFDPSNLVAANLPISERRFKDPRDINIYLDRIVEAVKSVPGVADVALTTAFPMQGWGYSMPFQIAGRPPVERAGRPLCFVKIVSPGYFSVLGLPLHGGRGLSREDRRDTPKVAVINETFRRRYFGTEFPIGQRVLVREIVPGGVQLGTEVAWQIVGIVADERVTSLDDRRDSPGIYVTNEQSPTPFQNVLVRASSGSLALQEPLRRAVYGVDKDQPLTDIKTIDEIRAETMSSDWLRSAVLMAFAVIALALAMVGVYGVISYDVAERTQEMGIRAALGATRGELLRMVLREGAVTALLGIVCGLMLAAVSSGLINSFLFGVRRWDAVTAIAAVVILGSVALCAAYIPARRATRISLLMALRNE
jgi:putative ABC transport system permease protein